MSLALRSRIFLLIAALLFSTGGAAIKGAALTGWQVASFRSGAAALFLLAVLPGARRAWSWRMVPVSAAYAATLVLFVLANRLTTAANTIFLQSTAPLYLLLLSPLLLREPIRRGDFLYMLAVAAGMTLFFTGVESPMATAPDPRRGDLLAAGAGLCYAFTIAGLRWLSRKREDDAATATVALGNVFACLAALPMAFPVRSFGAPAAAVIAYLGVFQIGVAYILLTRAIRRVPAFEATTILMLEPALNPVWTWLIYGERPGARGLAGGAIILSATLINTWHKSRG